MGITQQIGASSLIKPGVIDNTAARPASPYEGQVIYQKDTDQLLVWNGTAWYPNWNTAWGQVALTTNTTTDSTITAEEVQITSASFTAIANRYYRVTYHEPKMYITAGTTEITMRIRLTNISGTVQQTAVSVGSGTYGQTATTSIVKTFAAGATVLVATLVAAAATGSAERSATQVAYLLVEDIGPA